MAFFLTQYILIAFGMALAGVLGVFVASRGVERFGPRGVMTFYLWMILLGPTVRLMTAPREYLTETDALLSGYTAISGWVNWVLRLSSVSIVSVAAVVVLVAMIRREHQRGAKFFIVGLVGIALTMLTSATFGEKPAFIHQSLYTLLLLASLILMPRVAPDDVAIETKRVLVVLMLGSLVLGALFPNRYAETNYVGLIPGFHIRLHGLAPHANSLAPLALLYLLLAYWVPGKKFWHALGVTSALLVLVLTQSKTVWGAGVLIMIVVALVRLHQQFNQELRQARIGLATLFTLSVFFGGVLLLPWLFTDYASGLFNALTAERGVTTLTGRTEIWHVTIETWKNNPWFGYGPDLWDLDFRLQHGAALAAWHAHNQFIQALGEAGILGLIANIIYAAAFIYYGFKFAGRTRGISLALLLLILVRTVTEIPLRFNVLLDTTFFVHVVVFAVFLMLAKQDAARNNVADSLQVMAPIRTQSA